MVFDTRERSVQDGAPVEVFDFAWGATVARYTSADAQVTVDGNAYAPASLQRSQIETSAERARNAITITCARDFPIAELFRVAPPTEVIQVTVRRVHRGDADPAVIWMGRALNCEWSGSEAQINCEPVLSSLRRVGLRRKFQRQCPHVLYSQGLGACGVSKATHATATTVTSVAGLVLNVAALATKPWAGGFVEWAAPSGTIERRFIVSFSGLGLRLSQAFIGIGAGASVTVYPGCDHTMATCQTVYSNLPNYGGFPFVPLKNPFDGTPIF